MVQLVVRSTLTRYVADGAKSELQFQLLFTKIGPVDHFKVREQLNFRGHILIGLTKV